MFLEEGKRIRNVGRIRRSHICSRICGVSDGVDGGGNVKLLSRIGVGEWAGMSVDVGEWWGMSAAEGSRIRFRGC